MVLMFKRNPAAADTLRRGHALQAEEALGHGLAVEAAEVQVQAVDLRRQPFSAKPSTVHKKTLKKVHHATR